ncbi:uncharacterized protein LOC108914014 [Anoplophora glabripennis]|uniref:uncharacterized protein LOC108914014 n=1 Tax=Anoplophora glabripennis TaxID=217634 RepID=UPI0008757807|nr:uncharacterized protein LOC108914014 [Anoplophora glabripennis]
MAELDRKKKSRAVVRGAFTRLGNELEQLLSAQTVDLQKAKVTWELLRENCDDLKELDAHLYELLLDDATEEELLNEVGACDTYKRRYADLRMTLEKCQGSKAKGDHDHVTIMSGPVMDNGNLRKRKFKLLEIEFKRYDGNIRDWLSFWAQFKKVHEDPEIDNHDKIEYLLQATVPNSRARQLVENFPVIGANYSKIIKCMQSRFGREDLQIEFYVRELLTLILNNAVSKDKMDLCTLYDRIETQIRSLETLGITSEKCSALLFPFIESCLPQELLRVWQRTAQAVQMVGSTTNLPRQLSLVEVSLENRLENLMQFLKNEVENEQRITLVSENFGLSAGQSPGHGGAKPRVERKMDRVGVALPSATDLVNCDSNKCVFCNNLHKSQDCVKARKISLEDRKKQLTDKRACFRCLMSGHMAKKCRVRLCCVICSRSHVPIMCPQLPSNKAVEVNVNPVTEQTLANCTRYHVFLQTLRVKLKGVRERSCVSRVLIDSGSQRSYILKSTAMKLGYRPKRTESIAHCLFGGKTITQIHNRYDVTVCKDSYSLTFEVLDQPAICTDILPVFDGTWMEEVRSLNIELSDVNEPGPIELLLGADVASKIYGGDYRELKCGLVATKTCLGWTLIGKISTAENIEDSNLALTTLPLLIKEASITELWRLDVLGITEPSERKTKEELADDAKDFFLRTVKINQGRYEVRLPWIAGHPPLPDN